MKSVFFRFIILTVLVLSSISICLSNDKGCDDKAGYSKTETSQSQSPAQSEDHHCLCSMSCNNLFIEFSSTQSQLSPAVITSSEFRFTEVTYPQVLLTLDKPPII